MTEEERKKDIERWAGYIIPAVFKAETKLQKEHPEWKVRLATMTGENGYKVAEEYCRAIAEEIVGKVKIEK